MSETVLLLSLPAPSNIEIPSNVTISTDLSIQWQTEAFVSQTQTFNFNIGPLPYTWYQVQGTCQDTTSTPGLGIQTTDSKCGPSNSVGGTQQFIQTIVARGLDDLCNILTQSKTNWQLASVKQWSRPADLRLDSPYDETNVLTEVPFSQMSKCASFSLKGDVVTNMKVTTTVFDTLLSYVGSGGAVCSGSAGVSISGGFYPGESEYIYDPDGGSTTTGGSATVTCSWNNSLQTTMSITTSVENMQAIFAATSLAPALVPPSQLIFTNCGSCTALPMILYCFQNIGSATSGLLTDFMQRNGYSFPNPLVLHYSSRLQSWTANFHMAGTSNDNMTNETWRFTFEWACVNQIAGENIGSYLWKFSILAVRRNQTTQISYDTKLMTIFPPSQICSVSPNLGFNFSFNFNTATNSVSSNLNVVPNVVLLTDNIGLFKSQYWVSNPNVNIRLSQNNTANTVRRQDISSIFPQNTSLLASTTS